MKTKLVVQYTVGIPEYNSRCTGTWILVHDGSCEEFDKSLKDLMAEAVKSWYEQMLYNRRSYTKENLYYNEETRACKTLDGCEAYVSDVTIFHREDLV